MDSLTNETDKGTLVAAAVFFQNFNRKINYKLMPRIFEQNHQLAFFVSMLLILIFFLLVKKKITTKTWDETTYAMKKKISSWVLLPV